VQRWTEHCRETLPHRPVDHTFRIVARDGAVRSLQTRRAAEVDSAGRVIAVIGARQDITDERAHEAAVAELARARISAAERSRMLATVAHELRNPLSAVIGFAQMLQGITRSPDSPPSRASTWTTAVLDASRMMQRLTEDLLLLGTAGAAALTCQPQQVPLLTALQQAHQFARRP
jgi:signal transduction histidine kinase